MSSHDLSRPVALVADDDDVTRLMLSEAAEQAGLAVVSVADGSAALSIGLKTEFAVALLDVEMPGMNGHEVCRALRASAHARTLPIIMITGRDDAASVRRAFEDGATDFIAKPLNLPLIPRRLEYILRNAELLRTLEQREAEYRTLIQSIPDTVYVVGAGGKVQRIWNDPQAPAPSAEPRTMELVLPGVIGARAARSAALTARDGHPRMDEYTERVAPGEERAYEIRYFRCGTGEVMALRQDVTARKLTERRIHALAFTDPLTELPNRQSYCELLNANLAELAEGAVQDSQIAVTVLRLTGFERINETFGHSMGDEVIRVVADELGRCVTPLREHARQAVVARLEGDQFVMFICAPEATELSRRTAEAFSARMQNAVRCRQQEFFLKVTVGIATSPDHGRDAETLLKNASTALFECRSGRTGGAVGHAVYAEAMSARAQMDVLLDAELRRALAEDGLQLMYQPKFAVTSGAPLGAEALLRWTHPSLGVISPARLIPLAEESGLILDISEWVVRSVCRQIGGWRRLGLDIPIAVNLSCKDFMHRDPAALVAREAAAAGIPTSCLEFEITESVLVTDFERVTAGLAALQSLGCRVALDDFGTGYSSLGYLQRLPLDRLKVDRTFVTSVHNNPEHSAIYAAIIVLARSIGLAVTAEGVEEQSQLDWLRTHQCDEMQGFLLARPMSAGDLELLFSGVKTVGKMSAAVDLPAIGQRSNRGGNAA